MVPFFFTYMKLLLFAILFPFSYCSEFLYSFGIQDGDLEREIFFALQLVMKLNSHISWEYRLMIFSGPWHVHVYICITICLFIVPHQFPKVDLMRLPLRAVTTPHPSLHPLFSACAHNLDCCKGWYSRCMPLCLTTRDQIMPFLFTSEATLICYVIPVFLIVVNSYIDWEYRLVIVKGKYFLAYTLC